MLNYQVAPKKMTIGKKKGQTMYHAVPVPAPRLNLTQVEEEIVRRTSLSRGDVRNAVASLAEVVNSSLLSGITVDLGDLGTFKVEANGRMMTTEKEVNAASIKTPRIRHYPKHEMRRYAQSVPIAVLRRDGSVASSSGTSGGGSSTGGGSGGTSSGSGGGASLGTGGSL